MERRTTRRNRSSQKPRRPSLLFGLINPRQLVTGVLVYLITQYGSALLPARATVVSVLSSLRPSTSDSGALVASYATPYVTNYCGLRPCGTREILRYPFGPEAYLPVQDEHVPPTNGSVVVTPGTASITAHAYAPVVITETSGVRVV